MPHPWPLLLALTAPGIATPASVAVVPLSAIPQVKDDEPEPAPVSSMVDAALLDVLPGDEARVQLQLRLRALEPGWVDLGVTGGVLAVESALLDGAPVALPARGDGRRYLTARLDGEHLLRVVGSVASPSAALRLALPGAARTRVRAVEPGWDLLVQGGIPLDDGSVLLAESRQLDLSWRPEAPPAPKPRVITLESATAVSIDESGLEGRVALEYRVAHGSVDQVSFRLLGAPDSLQVEGAGVLDHQVQGDRVTVRLAQPVEGSFKLQLSFRAPPPAGDEPCQAPLLFPEQVHEHRGWVSLARSDTAMLVPQPGAGLQAVPSRELPGWATGLVPGTPVVHYRLSGKKPDLDYQLLRYDPVEAPPTVVDEARFQLATTEHGRALLKARYQVRNDRNQYLRLKPPAGFEVLGLRVAGQVREPVAEADGTLFIPLEKSVESLDGLVSFPVDVYLLGKGARWDRRGDRTISTPAVDAPVAYARWELWLPQDVEWRELSGVPRHVQDWTSSENSLEYGRAVKDPELEDEAWDGDDDKQIDFATSVPAPRSRGTRSGGGRGKRTDERSLGQLDLQSRPASGSAAVDEEHEEDLALEFFNQAYQAYNRNDFDQAERLLERSLQLDPANSSAQALMSNVGVVMGGASGQDAPPADDAQVRRVRELAQARTVDTQLKQKEVQKKAEEALRSGNLEDAERELAQLEEMTRSLSRLEQSESVEQELLLEETERQLSETRSKLARKSGASSSAGPSQQGGSYGSGEAQAEVTGSYDRRSMERAARDAGGEMYWEDEPEKIPDRFVELIIPEPSEAEEPWPELARPQAAPADPAPMFGYDEGGGMGRVDLAEEERRRIQEQVLRSKAQLELLQEIVVQGAAAELPPEAQGYLDALGTEAAGRDMSVVSGGASMLEVMEIAASDEPEGDLFPGEELDYSTQEESYRVARTRSGGLRRSGRRARSAQPASGPVSEPPVQAVTTPPAAAVDSGRHSFHFEETEIMGELVRPQEDLLYDRRQSEMEPLIQPRADFDGELASSISELAGGFAGLDDASAGWGEEPSEPLVHGFGAQGPERRPQAAPDRLPGTPVDAAVDGVFEAYDVVAQLANSLGGDAQVSQALGRRLAQLGALVEISGRAAAEYHMYSQQGSSERAEHEQRKVILAAAKAQQLVAEAVGLVSGPLETHEVYHTFGIGDLDAELSGGIGGLMGAKGTQIGAGGLGSRGSGLGGGGTAEGLGGLGTQGQGSGASGYGAGRPAPKPAADAPPPPPPVPPSYELTAAPAPPPPGGTTSLGPPPISVSAAHLVINLPKAGERLAFEQLLIAENEPLTVDIRYRTRSRK